MTENNDERLVVQSFQENKIEIPDNGFSRSVMRRLPQRTRTLSRLWTILCSAAGLAFFFLTDGMDILRTALGNVLGDIIGSWSSFSMTGVTPFVLFIAVMTLLLVTVSNLLSAEKSYF